MEEGCGEWRKGAVKGRTAGDSWTGSIENIDRKRDRRIEWQRALGWRKD